MEPSAANLPQTQVTPEVRAAPSVDVDTGAPPSKSVATDAGSGRAQGDLPPSAAGSSPAQTAARAGQAGLPAAGVAGASLQPMAAGASGVVASEAGAQSLPSVCSGCAQGTADQTDMAAHLHHVHLKVSDRERALSFYEQHLAAQRVQLNGQAQTELHSTPMLLLFDVAKAPVSTLPTALQHIGWGSTDTKAWYDTAHAQGVAPDTRGGLSVFTTNDTPMIGDPGSGSSTSALLGATAPACLPQVDPFAYMYVLGADGERIEICSGANERVNHLHFTTPDLVATSHFYARFLGAGNPNATPILIYAFYLDEILFVFEQVGQASDYEPTDEHVISHVAFSVSDLDAWLKRARDQNVQIVSEPAETHGFRSFFVRGPDGMLIELVQAAASKELCLNNAATLPASTIPKP